MSSSAKKIRTRKPNPLKAESRHDPGGYSKEKPEKNPGAGTTFGLEILSIGKRKHGMKKVLQKIVIAWIALMGIMGMNREKLGRNEDRDEQTPRQKEIMLDEFEVASYHNS